VTSPHKSSRRWLKRIVLIAGLFTIAAIAIFLLNSKSIELTKEDRTYIRRFLNVWHIQSTPAEVHQNFGTELRFISRIQDSVLTDITGEQIPHVYFGNVRWYYENRQGICYDRAVLLEKLMLFYHFSFRHVYLYFGEQKTPDLAEFFKEHIKSHAALEVKTKRGWMAIGTNDNWLGITAAGQLMNYFDVRKQVNITKGGPIGEKPTTIGGSIWGLTGYNFRIIYGVYSRHGDFFTGASSTNSTSLFTGKKHILPDYNWRMLLYNF
jgi:hypothetical protein